VIEDLPRSLSTLNPEQLEHARRDRDERMSILFRGWPSVNEAEMRELRKLSNERQRLATHVGTLRGLHALRAHSPRPVIANK
jgi:hypothetical protein